MATMASATTAKQEEEELMLRLQSQFGDMDLSNLLVQQGGGNAEEEAESEESSLAEPSPEELKAWQEAQFQKGQAQVQAKKEATQSAVQKRREDLISSLRNKKESCKEDDDWEQVPSIPDLQGQTSVFFPTSEESRAGNGGGAEIVGVHPLLQQLASKGDEMLGTKWQRLYSSSHGDGLSFANLMQKTEGYPGPTVLLIGAIPSVSKSLAAATNNNNNIGTKASTIGFFTTSSWSVGDSPDCFLFALDDDSEEIQFFRPKQQADNKTTSNNNNQLYIHCQFTNITEAGSHHSHTNGTTGLFVGTSSQQKQSRLRITPTLEECRALDYCTVFEAGDLLLGHGKAAESLNYFDVATIEVWAVGGDQWIQDSLQEQQRYRSIQESNRLKAQKIKDKHQLLSDFQGGLFNPTLQPNGLFAHYGSASNTASAERCDL